MAQVNNVKLLKDFRDKAKVLNAEAIPSQLAEKFIPVIIAEEEKEIKSSSAVVADATSGTLHACHATKKTYLVGAQLSVAKDAVNDSLRTHIEVTPKGKAGVAVLALRYEPTTAGSNLNTGMSFNYPILLEKGSNVSIVNGAATASIDVNGIIHYYEVD